MFPYAKEPMEALARADIQKVTLCWASQTSKTTTMYAGIAYLISEFPKDTLWILPSAENARNFSKGRWLPFVEDCKPLRAMCPLRATTGRIDSDRITNMRQEFAACTLTFTGAGSENNVKSAPVAYLVLDEIDEIEPDIRLAALERIKGRRDFKIVQTSTPKDETGGVWEEYLNGDQRKYFVPCPHCGEMITFDWRHEGPDGKLRYGIGFDDTAKLDDGSYDFEAVAASAHYRCPKCDGKIHDGDKLEMLKAGEWRAQNMHAPPGSQSYHLNSLYSPAMTFAGLITQWLQASKHVHGLRKFVQGYLSEPWREDWVNQDQNEANQLEQDYHRGELKGEWRIIAADTQTDHYRYVVRGFDRDGNSYLVDYGIAPGFADLDSKFAEFACTKGIVDCGGDRTAEVYEEVFRRRNNWFGSRGWAKMQEPYRLQRKDPFTGDTKGRANRGKFLYLHIDKSVWEPEIAQLRNRQMSGFHTFADTPKDYYDQLFSVYWAKETDRSGHIKTVRKMKRHKGDHYFDCECMARALAKFIGIARVDRETTLVDSAPRKPKNRSVRQRSSTGFWD
jgi:predicted RNA-binding Zn-ribbon protein involved in translation (DUF1610 family)